MKFESLLTPNNVQAFAESCPVNTVKHSVVGFGLGAMLGLFLSGMSAQSPEYSATWNELPARQQAKQVFRDMGQRSFSSAKNFALIGGIFSSVECVVETYRARHDIYNTAVAGAVTGGILSLRSGPKAVILGAAGFCAFSTAIEHFLID